MTIFQPMLPRGERPFLRYLLTPTYYFNPRSREGSDFSTILVTVIPKAISTHAPARGATIHWREWKSCWRKISTHAPARRATLLSLTYAKKYINHFNPRSREGSDQEQHQVLNLFIDFNPRSREGSDTPAPNSIASNTLFQPTLPRGERQCNR